MSGAPYKICRSHAHRLVRNLVAICLTLLYLVLAVGFPLGGPRPGAAERFPCENCSCGCSSAEQCWQNCCCFSPAERLAWADQEGVTPPPSVVAKLKGTAGKTTSVGCATGGCCCASQSEPKPRDTNSVAGWRALACQGKTLGWLAATPTLLHTASQRMVVVASFPNETVPLYSDRALGQIDAPPIPPPRSNACAT